MRVLDELGRLAELAEGQLGSFTEAQAASYGVSPDTLAELRRAGVCEEVSSVPGVLRLCAGGRHPFPRVFARWLALAPEQPAWTRAVPETGVVVGNSAAHVHGAGGLPQNHTEFGLADTGAVTAGPGVVLTRTVLEPDEWTLVQGLPVTRPGRTFADIATGPGVDLTDVEKLATAFLLTGAADKAELAAGIDRHLRRNGLAGDGRAWLDDLLAGADDAPVSPEGPGGHGTR
ncbi:type IV toxin-antitoxin system AbiEi family antitoxin domain-containing protein [Streptomonospora sp. S1-112]|uniref:Type IV toxin-antitoxin system AbiEi family antitoxin domain-containing protein n=1 Tax=Streptomonospora mangrovi TaxID=2883123 RepID=A0A9X3NRD0_9ACTN|nr:type IV toxin-antitoxin system AbiEi family antitoxin domain-containing protein [Streptomonospora mangrovi]MDA0566988.1 type IV toxin-antitoxin system AbiEi family antitoxin domain-containing protein [Streptomonospora mangrovi]